MLRSEIWRVALAAALLASCATLPSFAQNAPALPPSEEATVTPDDMVRAQDTEQEDDTAVSEQAPPLDDAALEQALSADPWSISKVAKSIRPPGAKSDEASWTRIDGANGATVYSAKKSLPAPWDASIGADFNIAAPAPTTYEPLKPLPGKSSDQGASAAWASVDVPYLATLGVRAEPNADRSRLGSSVSRSVPLGQNVSVTMQSSLAVTELYPGGINPAPAAVPGMASRIYDTDNSVKLNLKRTGTAFSVGTTTSSIDPMTHNRLAAEQNIYGPLNITGSLNDPGRPTSSKSIGAGLKFDW